MYAAAVAKDVRDAMLDIDLPEWARKLLTDIGDEVSMEQLSQVVQQIGVIKDTFDALGATLTGFAELTDDARMAIMEAAGGIEALAAALSEERGTLEDVVEPFLIQQGFLVRTARGRMATQKAWRHLGLKPRNPPIDLFSASVEGEDHD